MEAIAMQQNDYGTWNWDAETHQKANGFLHQLSSFKFFIAISITMRLLSTVRSVTVKLQYRALDVVRAYELVGDVLNEFESLKINVDEKFHSWFTEIVQESGSHNIPV